MSYLIDQEAWLAFYAERIGVDPTNLGERDIRLALATYHGVYLPTAATVELRANELDLRERYAEFGFEPNTPSFATARVRVQLATAGTSYTLAAPFIVKQGDLTFVATSPLTIAAGSTTGEADIIAQLQGADGTPQEAAAMITTAVGWLRGATITITAVSPGRDGETTEAVRAEFRAYAFNPQALVRAEDHADWIPANYPTIGRALAHPRTKVTYTGGSYTKEENVAGHLTIALADSGGGLPNAAQIAEVKDGLLRVTIPYGPAALHVVPAIGINVTGNITVVPEAGFDEDELRTGILNAIDAHLNWRTWPAERHVYAGDMWEVVTDAPGVRYVTGINLGGDDEDVLELEPWQYPTSGFNAASVHLA